ncbi:MAG: DUF3267 domain-containing protein, partial [Anaerolineaceae bacterium]
QPSARQGLWISILAGLGLQVIPFALLTLDSYLFPRVEPYSEVDVSWWILLPLIFGSIVVHEVLHLAGHPGGGLSRSSLVLVWPGKFRFGVMYDGWMSRERWLVMRLAPLAGLVALPTLALMLDPGFIPYLWRQLLVLVILINALGAGGDLAASLIVARQAPRGGEVGLRNGRACWRRG